MSDAGAAKEQVDDLAKVIAMFKDEQKIVYHIGKELLVDGKDILSRIGKAVKDFSAHDWESFGEDIGVIIGEVLSPEKPTNSCFSISWPFKTCCQPSIS